MHSLLTETSPVCMFFVFRQLVSWSCISRSSSGIAGRPGRGCRTRGALGGGRSVNVHMKDSGSPRYPRGRGKSNVASIVY